MALDSTEPPLTLGTQKKTGFALRGPFMREYLAKRPFYKENYDALIVQLSRLYNLVRTRGNPDRKSVV